MEVEKIPTLLKEGRKEEVIEFMNEMGLDMYQLLEILITATQKKRMDFSRRCLNCAFATRRTRLHVFCSRQQRKMSIVKTCSHFKPLVRENSLIHTCEIEK